MTTNSGEEKARVPIAALVGLIFGLMTALAGEGIAASVIGGAVIALLFWIGLPVIVRATRAVGK